MIEGEYELLQRSIRLVDTDDKFRDGVLYSGSKIIIIKRKERRVLTSTISSETALITSEMYSLTDSSMHWNKVVPNFLRRSKSSMG